MNGTCTGAFFWAPTPRGLWEGPKGQISFNLNYKVNFKDFKLNFVYLLTNERYITYHTGFYLAAWVKPRGGTWGYHGGIGVNSFPKFNQILCELLT